MISSSPPECRHPVLKINYSDRLPAAHRRRVWIVRVLAATAVVPATARRPPADHPELEKKQSVRSTADLVGQSSCSLQHVVAIERQ